MLHCRLLGHVRHFGAHGGRRGAGHIVAAAHLQLLLFILQNQFLSAVGMPGWNIVVLLYVLTCVKLRRNEDSITKCGTLRDHGVVVTIVTLGSGHRSRLCG